MEHNGKFWWYVPMTHKTIKAGEGFAIGVAVADHPLAHGGMLSGRRLSQTIHLIYHSISILVSLSTMELRTRTGAPGVLAGM